MMGLAAENTLVAHVRRLASDGALLYVRIEVSDVTRLDLRHGQQVEIDVGKKVRLKGIVKTSGGAPWLAPGQGTSNIDITAALREAGFEHGDDVSAAIRCAFSEPPVTRAAASVGPAVFVAAGKSSRALPGGLRLDVEAAKQAVLAYNAGHYRGKRNLDVDRIGYQRFRPGLPDDEPALTELVRFVGEDYGGAQRRFLPHGYREEAARICANLLPVLEKWRTVVAAARPLAEGVPEVTALDFLLAPFVGTKRWPVWASKVLHFLRPDAFPILDSRAKKSLGMASLGSSPFDFHRFCQAFHDCLLANRDALAAAREIDGGASPSDLKVLDKILYQVGG